MKKIVFLIFLKVILQHIGFAQNKSITKLVIPQKKTISLIRKPASQFFRQSFITVNDKREKAISTYLFFNDEPLIKLYRPLIRSIVFFTEFSFGDILETSLNSFKTGLVNTYDDHITELFKEAPSLVKVKCIISL